jgi:uncharacterized protein YcbK (DUF882 family)
MSEWFVWQKTDKPVQLTRNFSTAELACKCKRADCKTQRINIALLKHVQTLRDLCGALRVTSAYRCEAHNKAVGGSTRSQHKLGRAIDLQPVGDFLAPKPKDALAKLKKQAVDMGVFNGLGLNYATFLHVDDREGPKVRF